MNSLKGPKTTPTRRNKSYGKGASLAAIVFAAAAAVLARKRPETWAALLSHFQELLSVPKGIVGKWIGGAT